MKLLKQHPLISFCLFVYVCLLITLSQTQKSVALHDYKPTNIVLINDGNKGVEEHYVHTASVESVLNDLNIELGEEDSLNYALDYSLQKNDVLEITRVTYEELREEVVVKYVTEYVESKDTTLVGTLIKNDGVDGLKDVIYNVRKINGVEESRTQTSEEITLEPVNRIVETGTVTTGETYTGHLTSYGADCIGCGTRTAAGLYVTVNGVKDSGTPVLQFNGGEYYVVAASKMFPFGTILKISNHSYSIPDPCYAIVLDRGGAIKGTRLDIFSGSQRRPMFSGHGGTVNFEVIQYGNGRTSIY